MGYFFDLAHGFIEKTLLLFTFKSILTYAVTIAFFALNQ
ncbi:Uncharacterised protein [Moellerella wisconsensis]|nr:Uncharacterised protein [Moellerella wisconsensis]